MSPTGRRIGSGATACTTTGGPGASATERATSATPRPCATRSRSRGRLVVSNGTRGAKPAAAAWRSRSARSPVPMGRQTNGSARSAAEVERSRVRRRMAGRGDQHQLVGEQRRGDDARRYLRGHRAEREVDAVVREVVEQHPHPAGAQAELDVGMAGVEGGERPGEVERVERLDRADAHPADDDARQAGEVGARPFQLAQRAAGAGEEQLARVGERDVAGGAGEQCAAQLGSPACGSAPTPRAGRRAAARRPGRTRLPARPRRGRRAAAVP